MTYAYVEEVAKVLDSAGDKEVIVVCDFDHTITTADSDATLNAMAKYFGYDSEFAKARDALYQSYAPKLKAAAADEVPGLQEHWWRDQMNLFLSHKIPMDSYTDAIGKLHFELREEAAELFSYCEKQDIPVFIVSAGLGNLIIPILAYSGNLSLNMRVLANFIRYNEEKPASYTPVVTPSNKGTHLFLELQGYENYHAVIFGNEDSDLNLLDAEISTSVKVN